MDNRPPNDFLQIFNKKSNVTRDSSLNELKILITHTVDCCGIGRPEAKPLQCLYVLSITQQPLRVFVYFRNTEYNLYRDRIIFLLFAKQFGF